MSQNSQFDVLFYQDATTILKSEVPTCQPITTLSMHTHMCAQRVPSFLAISKASAKAQVSDHSDTWSSLITIWHYFCWTNCSHSSKTLLSPRKTHGKVCVFLLMIIPSQPSREAPQSCYAFWKLPKCMPLFPSLHMGRAKSYHLVLPYILGNFKKETNILKSCT